MSEPFHCRPLDGQQEYRACLALQREIWGEDFVETVAPALLWVAQRTGGIASGAFGADGALVGFIFGITGYVGGAPVHWSDMLGVQPQHRGRGIALALKLHQRALLLERGVTRVQWTFDPLESRNAHLNFNRLGATAREYIRDAYGASESPLHEGIGTDRLVVTWQLDASPRERSTTADDAPLINPVRTAGGMMACEGVDPDLVAPRLRLRIPRDIQSLKRRSPAAAQQWRSCTRAALEHYMARGYVVVALLREDVAEVSAYLLERAT